MAVRAMKLQDNAGSCIDYFGKFMCAMYFPPCQFRVIVPVCYNNCLQAYRNCGASRSTAKDRCASLSEVGMVHHHLPPIIFLLSPFSYHLPHITFLPSSFS